MKNFIIIVVLLFGINSFGQDKKQDSIKAIKEFSNLSDRFKKTEGLNSLENEALTKIKNEINATTNSSEITAKLEKQLKKIKNTLKN